MYWGDSVKELQGLSEDQKKSILESFAKKVPESKKRSGHVSDRTWRKSRFEQTIHFLVGERNCSDDLGYAFSDNDGCHGQ